MCKIFYENYLRDLRNVKKELVEKMIYLNDYYLENNITNISDYEVKYTPVEGIYPELIVKEMLIMFRYDSEWSNEIIKKFNIKKVGGKYEL